MNTISKITEVRQLECPEVGHLPNVTVIVPALNAERTIAECLDSLTKQTYPGRIEVCVIDNGSTDDTCGVATRAGVSKILKCPDMTVYAARNRAAKAAHCDVLAFIDSDCRADPEWIVSGIEALKESHVVSGAIIPKESSRKILYQYDLLISRRSKEGEPNPNVSAGNLMVSQSLFNLVDGFPEDSNTAGDSRFSVSARQLGARIVHISSCRVYHPVDSLWRRVRGAFRESEGSYLKKLETNEEFLLSNLGLKFRRQVSQLAFEAKCVLNALRDRRVSVMTGVGVYATAVLLKGNALAAIAIRRCLPRLAVRLARK